MTIKIKWMFIAILGMTLFFGLNSPLMAQAVWDNGMVTREAWEDRQLRIEVDGIKYMVMPDARVYLRSEKRPGAYNEDPIAIRKIRKGQKILMWHLGHNIYQIVVIEQR